MTTLKPRLRWFQYSLRTLLLVMLLASIGMSWVAVRMQRARKQKAAVEAIKKLGGFVFYDYEFDQSGILQDRTPPGPAWLGDFLGEDFLAAILAVRLAGTQVNDAGVRNLRGLTQLQQLYLWDSQITDAGLEHLKGMTKLQTLDLSGTRVTDAGLEHLEKLTKLQRLDLFATEVTDAGLEYLKGLTQLKTLDLGQTNVTDDGVKRLQRALPNCQIDQ